MSRDLVSKAAFPVLDAGLSREVPVPEGLTLDQMIDRAFPGIPAAERDNVRVLLVAHDDVAVVHPDYWHCTRPRPHVQVILRLVPGDDGALRSVLTVVITVAAMALGQFWAAAIVPTAGLGQTLVGGLITAGLTVAGTMLLNALIPIQQPDTPDRPGQSYAISGWQNTARPNEPVPFMLGRHRMAPVFAAMPYTTIIGDEQYVTALLTFGYGPLDISELRIGETLIENFTDVDLELREGRDDDTPIPLYPQQVIEERVGAELQRYYEDDAWVAPPIVRESARNATEMAVIFAFPQGLFRVKSDGGFRPTPNIIRIRHRLVGDTEWIDVAELTFYEQIRKPFFRQYRWSLPTRGHWEAEITRMNADTNNTDGKYSIRMDVAAVQSIRPEYPLNMDKPLALVGLRIKATEQLSGPLDNVNAVVQRYALDWDGSVWAEALSRNPATAYREALQSPQNPFPVSDEEIDLEQIEDWHEWCEGKGLKYDFIHQESQSFREQLMTICAAGRATPRHDGVRWGVVIDRPGGLVVDHINPRNSSNFRWRRNYLRPPHAFRVQFNDETNGWEAAERIVPWPGHAGDITLTEDLPLIGKTDPDEVWIEARRRQHELTYRLDSFTAIQDGGARVATRGDVVMAAIDVLDRTLHAARIMKVEGRAIVLDDPFEVVEGSAYALRYRTYEDDEDAIGASVVVPLITRPGWSAVALAAADIDAPRIGEIAHFGLLGQESLELKLRGIEAGDAFAQVVHMVAAAPEIDTLTDAEVPTTWTGQVGDILFDPATAEEAPDVPVILIIEEVNQTVEYVGGVPSVTYDIFVSLSPGSGTALLPVKYEIEHRLVGDLTWTTIERFWAASGIELGPYVIDDAVEIRARSLAFDGTPSAWTDTEVVDVGDSAGTRPIALDDETITVTPGLGHVAIQFAVSDSNTAEVQIYRVPDGDTLDPDLHAVGAPIAVVAGGTYAFIDGDSTRVDLALNGTFDSAANWTEGTGWSIGSGVATHSSGSAGRLSQGTSALTGNQRIAVTVSGRTAGEITPVLTGSDEVSGTAIGADGTFVQVLDANSASAAPTGFGFDGDADFDGAIDDVIRYFETAACIPAGAYTYVLAPHNSASVPGPLSTPLSAQVI